MNFLSMDYFAMTAHTRSFTRAAQQLHITQQTLSAHIAALERELGGLGIARWSNPKGGYFVCLDVLEGCAKRVVGLCREAGVTLTDAGAPDAAAHPALPKPARTRDKGSRFCSAASAPCRERRISYPPF